MSFHNERHRASERKARLCVFRAAGAEFLPVEAQEHSVYHHLIKTTENILVA